MHPEVQYSFERDDAKISMGSVFDYSIAKKESGKVITCLMRIVCHSEMYHLMVVRGTIITSFTKRLVGTRTDNSFSTAIHLFVPVPAIWERAKFMATRHFV